MTHFTRPIRLLRRFASSLPNRTAPSVPSPKPIASATSSTPQLAPLLDSYSRTHTYLRLSLTERCNLRCHYCMPQEGVPLTPPPHLLSTSELVRLSNLFVRRGVDKIRLTGGEPLLRHDLVPLVHQLNLIHPSPRLNLTTNGVLLARHLDPLLAAGLRGVNISLDTLVEAKFELIARRRGHGRVLNAIRMAAADPRLHSVKVNVVVMRGVNEDELLSFARLTQHLRLDVRFIEYMPFDGNRWNEHKFVGYAEMLERLAAEFGALEKVSDGRNDTTKHYRVPGFSGRVGFITSMSDHFCASCNRLRITADGNLKVCLFGREEVSLRDAMREGASDEEISRIIDDALAGKHWKLGGNADRHDIATKPNRSMIRIGG